jgi:hypothetical protein
VDSHGDSPRFAVMIREPNFDLNVVQGASFPFYSAERALITAGSGAVKTGRV